MEVKWVKKNKRLPEKEGLYLVCARSADEHMPMRHFCFYTKKEGFFGIVPMWINAIEYWMEYPKTPYKECEH